VEPHLAGKLLERRQDKPEIALTIFRSDTIEELTAVALRVTLGWCHYFP